MAVLVIKTVLAIAVTGFALAAWAALLNISSALDSIAKVLKQIEQDLRKF